MAHMEHVRVTDDERGVLRGLAARVAELAADPAQEAKREAVRALNRLDPVPPRIYCFPEAAWLEAIPPASLACAGPLLRGWETRLRMAIYTAEVLRDDQPVDAVFNLPWHGGTTGWGLEADVRATGRGEASVYYLHPYSGYRLARPSDGGAVHYDPPLREHADLDKLGAPEVRVDREASARQLDLARELFDGLLEVRRRGGWWPLLGGLSQAAVTLRGADALMLDLYDDPAWVRAYLGRLAEGHHALLDRLEAEGFLTLNNGCEWIHTGGIGTSDELPAAGFDPARPRCADLWGGVESQDLVGISPALFEALPGAAHHRRRADIESRYAGLPPNAARAEQAANNGLVHWD